MQVPDFRLCPVSFSNRNCQVDRLESHSDEAGRPYRDDGGWQDRADGHTRGDLSDAGHCLAAGFIGSPNMNFLELQVTPD